MDVWSEYPDATDYAGIDYSGPMGTCNRDAENGIRYGIMGQNAGFTEWLWESFDAEYSDNCPTCGNDCVDYDNEKHGEYFHGLGDECGAFPCPDKVCESCQVYWESSETCGDEPIGHSCNDPDYSGFVDSSGDVWCTKSPYYTRARFCSPCAPGACSLGSPCPNGAKAYCWGHDWFEGNRAPYPVWRVSDDSLVLPE